MPIYDTQYTYYIYSTHYFSLHLHVYYNISSCGFLFHQAFPQILHFSWLIFLQVLVLGSGHVAPPLIAYLTRSNTEVRVVSVQQRELSALKRMPGTAGPFVESDSG